MKLVLYSELITHPINPEFIIDKEWSFKPVFDQNNNLFSQIEHNKMLSPQGLCKLKNEGYIGYDLDQKVFYENINSNADISEIYVLQLKEILHDYQVIPFKSFKDYLTSDFFENNYSELVKYDYLKID